MPPEDSYEPTAGVRILEFSQEIHARSKVCLAPTRCFASKFVWVIRVIRVIRSHFRLLPTRQDGHREAYVDTNVELWDCSGDQVPSQGCVPNL